MDNDKIYMLLNPVRSIASVFGNICNNPKLLRDPDMQLNTQDFYQDIHQIIFDAINNLIYGEIDRKQITNIDIDNYLSEYPKAYHIWDINKGFEYIGKAQEFANDKNYEIDYSRVKKFSLLRMAHEQGLNITDIYDYQAADTNIIDDNMKDIDNMDINEIIDIFSRKLLNLRDNFSVTNQANTYKAGSGMREYFESIDKAPKFGYPFRNRFYNTIVRGMQKGKMMLRSAESGTGKTRLNLNDLIYVSIPKVWSVEHNDFVSTGKTYPSLYIGTEEDKDEINSLIMAIVSGIDQTVLEDGHYSPDVRERIQEAMKIVEDGQLYIHRDDDFSVTDIEMVIEKFIIDYGVEFVAFDYIQLTPKITRSAQQAYGTQLREDLIISSFAGKLKDIAQTYDVFLLSSTQLNRNSVDKNKRDSTALAGGRATQNKIDCGVQIYRADKDDWQQLEPILQNGYEKPNYSHWFYKNRGNSYPDAIIWTKMNLGNMHEKELFVTDRNYNLIDLDLTEIMFDENDEVTINSQKETNTHSNEQMVSIPDF